MITNTGTIVFSKYKQLEKIHGPDKTIGIIERITTILEKEGLLDGKTSNKEIGKRSEEIYQIIMLEDSKGFNPNV